MPRAISSGSPEVFVKTYYSNRYMSAGAERMMPIGRQTRRKVMLKVVGASLEKTRLVLFVLGSITLLAFILFFIEYPLEALDGNYAATVFWSEQVGFRMVFHGQGNDPQTVDLGAARAFYRSDSNQDGWASLEIETNIEYPDWVQTHAAGLLEGSLSWFLIYSRWQYSVVDTCNGREAFCAKVKENLASNHETVKARALKNDGSDPFWHQVHLYFSQLEGLQRGFEFAVERSRKAKEIDVPSIDFAWMNAITDIRDMAAFENINEIFPEEKNSIWSSIVKNISENQYLVMHASPRYYDGVKLNKRYLFRLHATADLKSHLVPGQDMVFTSYPGALYSQEDIYKVGGLSNITVTGVPFAHYKPVWKKYLNVVQQCLMGPRVVAANRLSVSGNDWAHYLNVSNSGTGIKQWTVASTYNDSVQVWLVEQYPGQTTFHEVTSELHNDSSITIDGIPRLNGFYHGVNSSSELNQTTIKHTSKYQATSDELMKLLSETPFINEDELPQNDTSDDPSYRTANDPETGNYYNAGKYESLAAIYRSYLDTDSNDNNNKTNTSTKQSLVDYKILVGNNEMFVVTGPAIEKFSDGNNSLSTSELPGPFKTIKFEWVWER